MMDAQYLGKCGFYWGCYPTFMARGCRGCLAEHTSGDCFTQDYVLRRGLNCCGACPDFPYQTILTQPKATVLDKSWLLWKKESQTNGENLYQEGADHHV